MQPEKTGVLLLNLGTPDDPSSEAVGRYLTEFLMDPDVVDIPAMARWLLVRALIVPRRKHASSALYRKIWSDRGSPLLFHTRDLATKVQELLGERATVQVAMRYGRPDLRSAFETFRREQIRSVTAFPLYPQFSLAATASSEKAIREVASDVGGFRLALVPPFYSRSEYLDAAAQVSRPSLAAGRFDKVLFSFHGLPERQVKKTDLSGGAHCLATPDCCETIGRANRDCYRAQCYHTAKELAARLGIAPADYLVGFQSRLGRTPWIRPYSDAFYRELPSRGVKRLAVLCPSFVADCLETLEEVQIRGLDEFRRHGGEDLFLVPSLNAEAVWASAVARLLDTAVTDSP